MNPQRSFKSLLDPLFRLYCIPFCFYQPDYIIQCPFFPWLYNYSFIAIDPFKNISWHYFMGFPYFCRYYCLVSF